MTSQQLANESYCASASPRIRHLIQALRIVAIDYYKKYYHTPRRQRDAK